LSYRREACVAKIVKAIFRVQLGDLQHTLERISKVRDLLYVASPRWEHKIICGGVGRFAVLEDGN
jgi:hypothetical protein